MGVHPGVMPFLLLCSSCPGPGGVFEGPTVTSGQVFPKKLQGARLYCRGTEQKELYNEGLGNSRSSKMHLACRRSLIAWTCLP